MSSDWKVYRRWDYYPSGRLSFKLTADWRESWQAIVVGPWRDQGGRRVEENLNNVIVALNNTAALIKHKRAAAEEAARRASELAEQRERAERRREYLVQRAVDYQRYLQLSELLTQLEIEARPSERGPFERIICELRTETTALRNSFSRAAVEAEITRRNLYGADDDGY